MSAQGQPGPPPMLSLPGIVEAPVRADETFPDLVDGYFPAGGTHIFSGPQNAGKTALISWMRSELKTKGEFLGHRGRLPEWERVFVFDRPHADWDYWSKQAGLETPEGYWVLEDRSLTIKTIRSWRDPDKVIEFWRLKVEEMKPVPGGLIITDGGLDLIGDGTTRYFDAYANVVAVRRIAREFKLTHLLICHAGKPKPLGSKDAKARDIDKANLSAGALGAADALAYLSCPEELVEAAQAPPEYQRFSWRPHHAVAEVFDLARTPSGLYTRQTDPTVSFSEDATPRLAKGERKADYARIQQLTGILEEQPEKRMRLKDVVDVLGERFSHSSSVAYRIIAAARRDGAVREEEGFLKILAES